MTDIQARLQQLELAEEPDRKVAVAIEAKADSISDLDEQLCIASTYGGRNTSPNRQNQIAEPIRRRQPPDVQSVAWDFPPRPSRRSPETNPLFSRLRKKTLWYSEPDKTLTRTEPIEETRR
jgi:hypothetical protein